MKKRVIIIIPIIIAVIAFIGLYLYYNVEDGQTSLTVTEKRWLEKNAGTIMDFEVINNFPLYGMNGNGVFFQFISDFEKDTKVEFNKLPYLKESNPSGTGLRFRVLNNETVLTDNDLLIFEDSYIAVSKTYQRIGRISEMKDIKFGVFAQDAAELSYYLKDGTNITYQSYDTIDQLYTGLDNGDVNMIIIPNIMYLDKLLGKSDYSVNFFFTEMSKKIVLTLSDNDTKLNDIVRKYYTNWKNHSYVKEYNKAFLDYYVEKNNMNAKTKADLISKSYVYGYVENAPYEVTINKKVSGISGEYLNRMARLTGIDFTYKKYKNKEELKKAIDKGEIDIYFDYYGMESNEYLKTVSTFVEDYVVLGKNKDNHIVGTLESLKGQKVAMLSNDALYNYFANNSRSTITTFKTIDGLVKGAKDQMIVVDREVYNEYHKTKLKDYEIKYMNSMTNDYKFMIKNDNQTFYDLFNYIINTNSYYRYRNSGMNSLNLTLFERMSFEQLYFIILAIILIPLTIGVIVYFYLKRKKEEKEVRKEDRRKYTDMLTSLKNRNYLNLQMKAWEESRVFPQAIVIIDLNNVKYVNDNYGHEAGDNLIMKAAATLVNTQLENSEIIRTDGNEFLIYLVGYSEQQMETYTKKLSKELKELPHGFGAALGFSMITDEIKTIDDAINEATLEMRTNKEEYK